MKIKKGFMTRTLAGEHIVIAVGEAAKDFTGVLKLNEVGYYLWNYLVDGSNMTALVSALVNEYDVSFEVAIADVERFMRILTTVKCLDE